MFTDGFELMERMCTEGIDEARRSGSLMGAARVLQSRSMLRFRQGKLREAVADARFAIDSGAPLGLRSALIALAVLIDTLIERGDLDAADAALVEHGMSRQIPVHFVDNWVLDARGRLRLAQRRWPEAIEDFEDLEQRAEQWHPWNPAMFAYRSGLALCLLHAGEVDRARTLAGEELEIAREWGAPRAIGISLRTTGLATGGERGLELLRESVAVLAGSGARLEHAHSLVELGAAIRRAGKRSLAREPLHAGMELAHACGAEPLAERAREELRATGARPGASFAPGVDALTPSELRVARMARDGMTNAQIAQALFVTAADRRGPPHARLPEARHLLAPATAGCD